MKIWIDGYEANVPQRLGSSQVAFNLLKALEEIDRKNDYTILLPQKPMEDLPKEREGWKYKILWPNSFKTWIALPWVLFSSFKKPDLFFSPSHYGPSFSPVKRVITIFDLSFLRFQNYFKSRDLWQLKLWTWISVKNAAHVITISKASKEDINSFYKVDKRKITVAYPGYDNSIFSPVSEISQIESVKEKYGISGNYAIYIGTIQPRKNLIRLIEAFKHIEHLKLVIVGKTKGLGRQGWMYEDILKKPAELGIEDKVIFTGFAPTDDLPALISGAKIFVWPSLWEGFGIPVIESMACGTPAIVSNVSSLPEIIGSAGIQVDPYSVEEIERAIRTLAFDSRFRQKKSKEGLLQAQKFSWEKMAKTVLKTFEEVTSR